MKKSFLFSFGILFAITILSFINPPNSLVGRWQNRFPNGVFVSAVFRSDSSYDGFRNGKAFVSGKYYVRQDTFAMADAGCGLAYYGTYKLAFFGNDSIRITAIQDTCGGRRRGCDGLTMGRVRSGKSK